MPCECYKLFSVKLARETDYGNFKQILNKGRHPAFIGKQTMMRNARQGGALFYLFDERMIAVSLINPHLGVLLVLNVVPEHRGHGLGRAIINFLMPNFARVLESKVGFFKSLDYVPLGHLKKGITLNTQIMVRRNLLSLAGNLKKAWG